MYIFAIMNTYEIDWDKELKCYFVRSKNFPHDAKSSHQTLHGHITFDPGRLYMGLSKFKPDGSLEYLAACSEINEGELKESGLEFLVIQPGKYLCADLEDYMQNIDKIGEIFAKLTQDIRFDSSAWAIELYEMNTCVCMIPIK